MTFRVFALVMYGALALLTLYVFAAQQGWHGLWLAYCLVQFSFWFGWWLNR